MSTTTIRSALASPLGCHVLRRLPLTTLGAAAVLSGGFVWVWATRRQDGIDLIGYLRCPTVVLAAVAAQFLDDTGAPLLNVTPRGRRRRRVIDAIVALALVFAAWMTVAMIGFVLVGHPELLPEQFPWAATLLEVTALTLLGFVIMCVVAERTGPGNGSGVALVIGVAALGTLAVPQTNAWLWPTAPLDDNWRDAHVRWAMLAVLALGALILVSRDPARRGPFITAGRRIDGRLGNADEQRTPDHGHGDSLG